MCGHLCEADLAAIAAAHPGPLDGIVLLWLTGCQRQTHFHKFSWNALPSQMALSALMVLSLAPRTVTM